MKRPKMPEAKDKLRLLRQAYIVKARNEDRDPEMFGAVSALSWVLEGKPYGKIDEYINDYKAEQQERRVNAD